MHRCAMRETQCGNTKHGGYWYLRQGHLGQRDRQRPRPRRGVDRMS